VDGDRPDALSRLLRRWRSPCPQWAARQCGSCAWLVQGPRLVLVGLAVIASLAMSLIGASGLGSVASAQPGCGGAAYQEPCHYDSRDEPQGGEGREYPPSWLLMMSGMRGRMLTLPLRRLSQHGGEGHSRTETRRESVRRNGANFERGHCGKWTPTGYPVMPCIQSMVAVMLAL
jgi:hypothetical protein